jgi:hypothetical protein
MPTSSSAILSTLLLCGLLGLLGQGVRAAVGLKKAMGQGAPDQQSEFNAAYLLFSLMIGFIAGILAALAIGLTNLITIDLNDMKVLLGIAAAGYAGADFIENTFSIILPGSKGIPSVTDGAAPKRAPDASVQALGAHVANLTTTVSSLAKTLGALPRGPLSPTPADDDPAAPEAGEISNAGDFATARALANLGAPGGAGIFAQAAPQALAPGQSAILSLDFSRAQAFLTACETSVPRVTYGLGKKVPFLGAVPGKDFTQVDCSGFVREAIRVSTNPPTRFPDGSVVQHDWVEAQGFARSTVVAGRQPDGVMRIAFLRPQDAASGVGHVVLIVNGNTLESHGGTGPDSRAWTGAGWQAKTSVYELARDVPFAAVAATSLVQASRPLAATFTVHHGGRYRATITLSGLQQFASIGTVADELTKYGFANVVVTGSGATRVAEGVWTGPDTAAQIDSRLTNIVELPPAAPATVQDAAAGVVGRPVDGDAASGVAAPAIISPRSGRGLAMSNVFSTASLPAHHEGMLVVKVRDESLSGDAPLPMGAASAMSLSSLSPGLGALSFYERAGRIKRVTPLRRETEQVTRPLGISAVSALTFAPDAPAESKASKGVSIIELERGQDLQQLQTALANDPNILSVSKVPARYLVARASVAAVPPSSPIMWNLQKISWSNARAAPGFRDADTIQVAVLDTGVDENHPALQGQIAAYHWQHPDISPPVSDRDLIGHGTHVSGTIAAIIGNANVKGICKCRLSVWKIFNDMPTYEPALGAYYYFVDPLMYRRALIACVENPVDVINLSIGGTAPPDPATEGFLFDHCARQE